MDFDESKHPRDRFGQFTQKGLGHLEEHPPVGAKSLPNRRLIGFESPIKNEARSLGIEIKDNDKIADIKAKIKEAKESAISLDGDSKLKNYIEEQRKAGNTDKEWKLVANYIASMLGNEYDLKDGLHVYIDNNDRNKLANTLFRHHPEQIANIKAIIDNSILDHEFQSYKGEKDKFSNYKYYLTRVKYKGEVMALWLNVGLTKNDKTWHIYDITKYKPDKKR